MNASLLCCTFSIHVLVAALHSRCGATTETQAEESWAAEAETMEGVVYTVGEKQGLVFASGCATGASSLFLVSYALAQRCWSQRLVPGRS